MHVAFEKAWFNLWLKTAWIYSYICQYSGGSRPSDKEGGGGGGFLAVSKKIFSALWASFWSKNRGAWIPWIRHCVNRPFPVYSSEQRHQKLTLSLRKFSDLYRRVSTSCNYVCYNWTGIWKEAIQSKNITFVSL